MATRWRNRRHGKERGRKEERNQGTNGIMEQNKDDEALRQEIGKFLGVTSCYKQCTSIYEDASLLGCCAALIGKYIQTFRTSVVPSCSKDEGTMCLRNI